MSNSYSIIVPIYNSEKTLHRCIDSILLAAKDGKKSVQIILVNDGSSDRSDSICKEYTVLDPTILLIEQKNLGVSAARNAGLRAATGQYILFVDSDDCMKSDCFQIIDNVIRRNPSDYYIFSFDEINSENRKCMRFQEWYSRDRKKVTKKAVDLIVTKAINTPWAKVYIRNIVIENGIEFPYGLSIAEDAAFNTVYSMHINSIYISDQPVYDVFKDNSNSLSRGKKENLQYSLFRAVDYQEKRLELSNLNETEKKKYLRAFGFLQYSSVYSHAKQMIKDDIPRKERCRQLWNDIRDIRREKVPFPCTPYCICLVLPVLLRMAWFIDCGMKWIYKE